LQAIASRIETLRTEQLRIRKAAALQAAARAVAHLSRRGIEARLIGSLKQGDFGIHSDIDFLVTSCPADLMYAVEGEIEDIMNGLPFDLIYLDLLPIAKRESWLKHAR
jgi:predicted nucleotidyltransferase